MALLSNPDVPFLIPFSIKIFYTTKVPGASNPTLTHQTNLN